MQQKGDERLVPQEDTVEQGRTAQTAREVDVGSALREKPDAVDITFDREEMQHRLAEVPPCVEQLRSLGEHPARARLILHRGVDEFADELR